MNKIIKGDSLIELEKLDENSVDAIITDPPYGLSFMGKKWDYDVPSIELWQECLRVLKPGGTALIFGGSRTYHRMAVNVEDAGFTIKDCIMWLYGSGFPKSHNISKALDKKAGAKRKVVGKKFGGAYSTNTNNIGIGEMFANTKRGEDFGDITEPQTPEAKLWEGYGTALKPAYEPIIVAQKPKEGTYAENAIKYGVAGLNIAESRVGTEEITTSKGKGFASSFKGGEKEAVETHAQGRFPANLIHDGSDEVTELFPNVNGAKKGKTTRNKKNVMFNFSDEINRTGYEDNGSAARFFYTAKPSKKERNSGCEELGGNKHCTVKPLKLIEYLCTLTKTPTNGIVLDPFAGSGTTGVACINTGREYILIEKEEEYIPIIKARIKHAEHAEDGKEDDPFGWLKGE